MSHTYTNDTDIVDDADQVVRPSKEEKARKEAAKMALLAAQAGDGIPPTVDGQVPPPIPASPVAGEEEDAEGEEE